MLFGLAALWTILICCDAMTMKQFKNTGKMMRKTCQPRNNVEDEKIDPIKTGVFIEEKPVMCYMACILKMANTLKNNKINLEASLKQADIMLPEDVKEPAKVAIRGCFTVSEEYKDICESAFYFTLCVYNSNNEIFYFP